MELAERIAVIESVVYRWLPEPITERERQLVRALVVGVVSDPELGFLIGQHTS